MRSCVWPFLTAAAMLVPSTADAQWPSTDWKVFCYTPSLQQWLAPDGSGDTAGHSAYQAAIAPYVDVGRLSCDDSDPYSETSQVRENLRQISEWLEGQGFPPPNVPFVDGRFQAAFVPTEAHRVCYHGECADRRPFYAYVGSTTRAQNETNPNVLLLRVQQHDQAHELFHAVQHAFNSFQTGNMPNWIKEGTAEAVGLSWSRASAHTRLSTRDFSESLHRSAQPAEVYNDEAFWRAAFRDQPLPERYGHLAWLFGHDPGSDALVAIDSMFRQKFGLQDGLADAYPQVLAAHLAEKRFYGNLTDVDLAFPDTVRRWRDQAANVGANGYLVTVEIPEDEAGRLTIRVPRELDEEYLHLIVDDQVRDEAGPVGQRNEYTTVLSAGSHEFLVRLANVPTNLAAVAANGFDDAPIEFMLQREYASVQVTGGDTGDAPPPADIARPLEFDVAEGDFRVLYAAPGGTLDLDHPICQVRIHLRSRQEDALSVVGNLSPPIRAGTYPIVRNPGGDIDRLGSHLYTSRTAGRGRFRMRGRSGSLEIEGVENLMIEGSLWTHLNLGLEGGDVNLLVRAEFSLQPGSGVGGILGPKGSDHPCFTKSDGPSPSRGDGDGRENGENQDPEEQQDPEEHADGPGGLPEFGESDDPNAPGEPRGQPQRAGDGAPSEDSGVGAPAGGETALQLQFLDERGGLIRSRPHVVRGNHSSERTDISASSFDLQLGFPLDFLSQCTRSATTDRRVEGIAGLLASGRLQQDGQFLVDISDAELDLDSTTDGLRLEIEYERCREPSGCSTDLLVLRTTDRSGGVELATTGESLRVDVTGATLEATVDGHAGLCRNLIDFTFDLRP